LFKFGFAWICLAFLVFSLLTLLLQGVLLLLLLPLLTMV
jgi:hypothetical protein